MGQQVFTRIDARTWWAIGNFREGEFQYIRAWYAGGRLRYVETEFAIFRSCGQRGLWRYS